MCDVSLLMGIWRLGVTLPTHFKMMKRHLQLLSFEIKVEKGLFGFYL